MPYTGRGRCTGGGGCCHCVGVPACGLITSFIMHFFPAFPVFTAHATRHINVAINLALPRHVARQQVEGMGVPAACSTRSNCSATRTSSLRSQVVLGKGCPWAGGAATFAQITCNLFGVLQKSNFR